MLSTMSDYLSTLKKEYDDVMSDFYKGYITGMFAAHVVNLAVDTGSALFSLYRARR